MNSDELFTTIEAAGYVLGSMCQTAYVQGSATRADAWSAHFHNSRGEWIKGFGRTPKQALSHVVQQLPLPVESTSLEDFI